MEIIIKRLGVARVLYCTFRNQGIIPYSHKDRTRVFRLTLFKVKITLKLAQFILHDGKCIDACWLVKWILRRWAKCINLRLVDKDLMAEVDDVIDRIGMVINVFACYVITSEWARVGWISHVVDIHHTWLLTVLETGAPCGWILSDFIEKHQGSYSQFFKAADLSDLRNVIGRAGHLDQSHAANLGNIPRRILKLIYWMLSYFY